VEPLEIVVVAVCVTAAVIAVTAFAAAEPVAA
jgi:hypothetical protein